MNFGQLYLVATGRAHNGNERSNTLKPAAGIEKTSIIEGGTN